MVCVDLVFLAGSFVFGLMQYLAIAGLLALAVSFCWVCSFPGFCGFGCLVMLCGCLF